MLDSQEGNMMLASSESHAFGLGPHATAVFVIRYYIVCATNKSLEKKLWFSLFV